LCQICWPSAFCQVHDRSQAEIVSGGPAATISPRSIQKTAQLTGMMK
jgi:hypothetical protein